jgi:hypothetical protein
VSRALSLEDKEIVALDPVVVMGHRIHPEDVLCFDNGGIIPGLRHLEWHEARRIVLQG